MATKTYIIAAGDSFVKIGVSTSPISRCREIQPYCPIKLKILLILDGNHEPHLHRKFSKDRLHGEWFTYSKEIKVFVDYFPYSGEQPEIVDYHGNRGVPLSPEHRAAIAATWEKKRQAKESIIALDDLPKYSPIYKKRIQ